jgi:amidase
MVAAGVLPLSHATDGGGSIRIPAGVNGNIGLKPSRGVFSIAPGASDLTGLVSTQGCQSRSVRDTAAFVDHCRGGAPGEFMPYWMPAEPYVELIRRDPGRLRIALSHEWGDYRATPHIAAELARVGRFLEGLGHQVDWALPEVDFRAAFAAQTTCYISNFAQTISNMLAAAGSAAARRSLIEPINIKHLGGRHLHTSFTERARMQAVFNTTARGVRRVLRVLGHHPDADHRAAHAAHRHHRVPDDQRQPVGAGLVRQLVAQSFAYTPLANLCGIPGIVAAAGLRKERPAAGDAGPGPAGQRRAAAAVGRADRAGDRRAVECGTAAAGACDGS